MTEEWLSFYKRCKLEILLSFKFFYRCHINKKNSVHQSPRIFISPWDTIDTSVMQSTWIHQKVSFRRYLCETNARLRQLFLMIVLRYSNNCRLNNMRGKKCTWTATSKFQLCLCKTSLQIDRSSIPVKSWKHRNYIALSWQNSIEMNET